VERKDLVLAAGGVEHAAGFASEFEGGFVGFGAGVADEDFGGGGHAAGGEGGLNEGFGEEAGPGVVVEVGDVD